MQLTCSLACSTAPSGYLPSDTATSAFVWVWSKMVVLTKVGSGGYERSRWSVHKVRRVAGSCLCGPLRKQAWSKGSNFLRFVQAVNKPQKRTKHFLCVAEGPCGSHALEFEFLVFANTWGMSMTRPEAVRAMRGRALHIPKSLSGAHSSCDADGPCTSHKIPPRH